MGSWKIPRTINFAKNFYINAKIIMYRVANMSMYNRR